MEPKTLYQVELKSIGTIQGDLEALDNLRELILDSALHMSNMVGFCAEEGNQDGVKCFASLHDKMIEDYHTLSDLFMKLKTSADYGFQREG